MTNPLFEKMTLKQLKEHKDKLEAAYPMLSGFMWRSIVLKQITELIVLISVKEADENKSK